MKKSVFILSTLSLLTITLQLQAQVRPLTTETLWGLKRVGADGISHTGKTLYYSTHQTDVATEQTTNHTYAMNLTDGSQREVSTGDYPVFQRDANGWYAVKNGILYKSDDLGDNWEEIARGFDDAGDMRVSPDGRWIAYSQEVLVTPMLGTDKYPDLQKTTARVYTDLNYRHWDTWEDGKYNHIFISRIGGSGSMDIMPNEPYDCPGKPFGGAEDFVWNPNSKGILYCCKKKVGKAYAQSTNTDLYYYNVLSNSTENWTEGMMGYDNGPQFSSNGYQVAWVSMKRDGFEADKADIIVMDIDTKKKRNITEKWDESVNGFIWDRQGSTIYFNAAWMGTEQLFKIPVGSLLIGKDVERLTKGVFDINGIAGQASNGQLIVSRCDMNHASELFEVDPVNGEMGPLTHANDDAYRNIAMSRTELKMVKTTDGKMMGVWVIYPPDFDPKKKYPTLLYCQGGPQSALSQFYSFRWNFQLMAAHGYIVVAPNRRGMPGWGVKWNESISKDWGGQPMRDYLSAIDEISKYSYVDKNRRGCIGASYGGYSVYMLAGMHNKRFKTFIAHDGLFDLKSWYGTTEELWFANWDVGGNYWSMPAPKSYQQYNPSNFVSKWTAPIMIIQGGLDYRVPIEQGLEAFQAAQLRGIKSKMLYLPNENHWVLHAQNAIAWQREFYSWLDETLK